MDWRDGAKLRRDAVRSSQFNWRGAAPGIAACLLVVIAEAVAGEPQVQVTRLGDGAYELVLTTTRTTEVAEGQKILLPYAEHLCGGKHAAYDQYKFDTREPVAPNAQNQPELILHQRIHCGPDAPEDTNPPLVSLIAHDDQAIERLTYQYLALKDAGKFSAAFALLTDSMKASTTLDSWTQAGKAFNAAAGAVRKRQVRKITWYDNPPSAPVPGIYAAADYTGDFEKLNFDCGYIVWLATADGFRLVREENNSLDQKTRSGMTPDQVAAFRNSVGC